MLMIMRSANKDIDNIGLGDNQIFEVVQLLD
jgi:hypothetical protein